MPNLVGPKLSTYRQVGAGGHRGSDSTLSLARRRHSLSARRFELDARWSDAVIRVCDSFETDDLFFVVSAPCSSGCTFAIRHFTGD